MDGVIIRKGNEGDVIKVSRLWLEMLKEMKPEYTPNIEWWRTICIESLRSKRYMIFIAELGGSIKGFLDLFLFPEPSTGKIHAIGQHFFIRPNYRKNGIAYSLYKRAIKESIKNKASIFELFCFDNEKDMWMKKGFKPIRNLLRKEMHINV